MLDKTIQVQDPVSMRIVEGEGREMNVSVRTLEKEVIMVYGSNYGI